VRTERVDRRLLVILERETYDWVSIFLNTGHRRERHLTVLVAKKDSRARIKTSKDHLIYTSLDDETPQGRSIRKFSPQRRTLQIKHHTTPDKVFSPPPLFRRLLDPGVAVKGSLKYLFASTECRGSTSC
jgi:hypothetical protein